MDNTLVTVNKVKKLDYCKDKWIYEQTDDGLHRYVLGTKGTKPLMCIGVNPSTASPEDLDPTLKSVERFALRNGYDSFIMFNVYPIRATNPDHMPKEWEKDKHMSNLEALGRILSDGSCDIWAAWGTIIKKRNYLKDCLKDIYDMSKKYNCNWVKIGNISKEGHPHHPLYLKKESPIEPFNIEEYIREKL